MRALLLAWALTACSDGGGGAGEGGEQGSSPCAPGSAWVEGRCLPIGDDPECEPDTPEGDGVCVGANLRRARHDDALVSLGASPPRGAEFQDVWLGDGVAFACSGNGGLHALDVSEPTTPVERFPSAVSGETGALGSFGRCQHVVASPDGRRVFAAARPDQLTPQGALLSADVNDLRNPTILDLVQSEMSFEGLDLSGDRLLVAAHGDGLREFQVGEAGALREVGAVAIEDAWGARSHGDLVAVAAGRQGVALVELDGAGGGVLRARLDTGGLVRDVEWLQAGARLVVAAGPAGVQIWDVADRAAPRRESKAEVPGTAMDVSVSGDTVFVVTFNDLRALDASATDVLRPVAIETVRTSDTISRPLGVSSRGELIAVAEWGGIVMHRYDDSAAAAPEVEVDRQGLDFGRVRPGTESSLALVLHNRGSAELILEGGVVFTTDPQGGPVFRGPDSFPFARVEPGGDVALEVSVTPPTEEPLRGLLRLFTDDPDERSFEIELRANDRGLEVGEDVPDFEIVDLQGEVRRLGDQAGSVVLLAWFGTYCPACAPDMADLETVAWRGFKERGLVMWGLNPGRGDTAGDVRTFADQLGLTFPLMFDDADIWKQFERSDDAISAFPIHVLIGRDGRIALVRRTYERTVLVDAIEAAL